MFDISPPRGGIGIMAALLGLAGLYFLITGGDSWYTTYVCPAFFPIGIGLWLKHSWARWLTFVFFCAIGCLVVFTIVRLGPSKSHIIPSIVILSSLHSLWEWKINPEVHVD